MVTNQVAAVRAFGVADEAVSSQGLFATPIAQPDSFSGWVGFCRAKCVAGRAREDGTHRATWLDLQLDLQTLQKRATGPFANALNDWIRAHQIISEVLSKAGRANSS
jgi:hypothetical protein